jgi:hypothetical protein
MGTEILKATSSFPTQDLNSKKVGDGLKWGQAARAALQ